MKGDFTRTTFHPDHHYSRVLMQQGRVQLDADYNEQTAILLHYIRTLARDLGGPYWGPSDECGFNLDKEKNEDFLNLDNLTISQGRYYVDGILCENDKNLCFTNQPGYDENAFTGGQKFDPQKNYYVYLDVWERHIAHVQDKYDTHPMREVALGGPDTCTRAEVVWQVKMLPLLEYNSPSYEELKKLLEDKACTDTMPKIKARLKAEQETKDPCSITPESRYRGLENQLYRIEVHRKGNAWDGKNENAKDSAATFKWSRDNGSIVFPVVKLQGKVATLHSFGRDERTSLKVGDWVEIIDDDNELRGEPGIMAQVDQVDRVDKTVTLKQEDNGEFKSPNYDRHPLLRKWDHKKIEGQVKLSQGAMPVTETTTDWIEIEDGIEIQFQPSATQSIEYRTGDYWLIPARVATGKIDWPCNNDGPLAREPFGIEHHYAPLGQITSGVIGQDGYKRRLHQRIRVKPNSNGDNGHTQ
jgi:hypothetical protein